MAKTHVLLSLTDAGLTSWAGTPTQLRQEAAFSNDDSGLVAFDQYIESHSNAAYSVLFDLQDEDCRLESIPHVSARARRIVFQRRLNQLYRGTTYRSATPQGREKEGRRDDRILYSALTNATTLDKWLAPLTKYEVRLTGIYSVALLTARHARLVEDIPERALIVSRQFGGGLRQTYLADGSLRFSRLTPLEGNEQSDLVTQLVAEAGRARQFLASLRAIERTEVMQVVMLCSESEAAAFPAICPNSELIHYQFVPLSQVGKSLGVHSESELSTAEPIWLRYIATKKPSNQYASPAQLGAYHAWRLGRTFLVLAVLCLLASTATSVWYWRAAHSLKAETAAFQQRQAQAENIYTANVPKTQSGELTPTGMKNVVLAYQQLIQQWPDLVTSMNQVSSVLVQFPQAEIEELGWQVSTDPQSPFLDDTSQIAATTAATPALGPDGTPLPQERLVLVRVKCNLPHYAFRYREALALVDSIKQAFMKLPGAKVDVIQQPIDIRPESHLALDTHTLSNEDDGTPFTLKVILPAAPASREAQP